MLRIRNSVKSGETRHKLEFRIAKYPGHLTESNNDPMMLALNP